jgi:hypothetical protein
MKERDRNPKTDKAPQDEDAMMQLALLYLRHLVGSLALGVAIWLLVMLGPLIGVKLSPLLFMPVAYTVALSFFRHPGRDRSQALSFSVLIGFLLLLIIRALSPFVNQILNSQ